MLHNFNAGPSILPGPVLREASEALLQFRDSGLSILEIGHRTPLFQSVMEEARELVRELMALDKDHVVLFLHGGASTQFMQVPLNLLDPSDTAAYADTGVWSSKAIKEARLFGKIDVVCSSADKQYRYIPQDFAVPHDARYFHITTNNTIYGTQWPTIPQTSHTMVADMSSDILSRSLDFNRFGLIYAGAQKNLGPAGTTLVVVNPAILGKTKKPIPTMMDYRQHIAEGSMLNTPPVFAVYVSLLYLRWLKASGGVTEMERRNREKARLLYDEIDSNELFYNAVHPPHRSLMNVCFAMTDPAQESRFLQYATEQGIVGIQGHRLAGAFRASLYNALPMESVRVLVEVMRDYTRHQA